MNKTRASIVVRWVLAAAIGGGGVFQLARVMSNEGDWMTVFGKSLYGIAGMLSGVLLISPDLVRLAVIPLNRMVDNVLMPSESEPPPADYHLARFYHQQRRFEEACEEYLKIIHYHPEQTDAYLEGIASASLAGNANLATKFYRRGRQAVRSKDARQLLKSVYDHRHTLEILDEDDEESAERFEPPGPAGHSEPVNE